MLTPDQDSGSLRTIRLLRILVQMGCKVTFIADNLDGAEPYRTQLASEGIEVIHAPYCQSVEDYLKKHGDEYDVITLCRHYIAIQHTATVRAVNPGAQIWFDTIDLHYLRSRRQFALDNKKSTQDRAELAYREEMSVIAESDVTLVVSDIEVEELAKEAPNALVAVVSNIHEPQAVIPPMKAEPVSCLWAVSNIHRTSMRWNFLPTRSGPSIGSGSLTLKHLLSAAECRTGCASLVKKRV